MLVIGAGGIGCELIKNLALLKVGQLTIVDLDTVDVSNLNRQFLFRKEHVGKPKAEVAAEAARKLNPGVLVEFMCDNIKNFDQSFVARFDVVMSALDNIDARRYLNRLCLLANCPLIEAGSTGYIGQSRVILRDKSECYECQKKEAPKVYPVCTIRSAPSTPIHCIQWAKLLFELLFGASDDSSIIKDQQMSSDSPVDYLRQLFHDDIVSQAQLTEKWVDKKPPIPVDMSHVTATYAGECSTPELSNSQRVLSVSDYIDMFVSAVRSILTERKFIIGQMSFSKDDAISVDFVAAASNLRMFNYHIPLMSRWDIESIAGAIVPAIATTNAIVAGLQCFNLAYALKRNPGRDLWVRYPHPSANGSIVQSSSPPKPNPDCFICQNRMVTVSVRSFAECTLSEVVRIVILSELAIKDPVVILNGNLIYDYMEDEEDIKESYEKSLEFWEFTKSGQMIQVEDSLNNQTFHISVKEFAEDDVHNFWVNQTPIVSSKRHKQN